MALTHPHPHPHPHHPHTRSENLVLWAAAAVVAALAAFVTFQVTDNANNNATISPAVSISDAYTGPVSALTGLIETDQAPPAAATAGSESQATANPAAASATRRTVASADSANPAQSGAVNGPAAETEVTQVRNSLSRF